MNLTKSKTMKNTFLTLAIASTLFISCGEDDTADIIINNTDNSVTNNTNIDGGGTTDPVGQTIYISGIYTDNLELKAINNYILNGAMIMASGTTLTIEAGTTIKAIAGTNIYIAISQGAKIAANGTADAPIIMTANTDTPKAGYWGGLIILGKAPINSVATGTSTSEIGGLPYGGTDPSDDSGSIQYVRVQYSGGKVNVDSENNGFSFYAVGNGTIVKYIEAYEGADDGIEFYGGTVNVDFVSCINSQDDSIDWTEGYSGKITNAYIVQGVEHDKAFEMDGYNPATGNNASPKFYSNPTITNVTVYGYESPISAEAMRLRVGTKGTFKNIVLNNFTLGTELKDAETGDWVVDNTLNIVDITFIGVTTNYANGTGVTFAEADLISGIGNGTGTDYATWGAGWTVQ